VSKNRSQYIEVARFRKTTAVIVTRCQGLTVGTLSYEPRTLDPLRRGRGLIFTIAAFHPGRYGRSNLPPAFKSVDPPNPKRCRIEVAGPRLVYRYRTSSAGVKFPKRASRMENCGFIVATRCAVSYDKKQGGGERTITHTPEQCTATHPSPTKTTEAEPRFQRRPTP